jgi:hypothetical protein
MRNEMIVNPSKNSVVFEPLLLHILFDVTDSMDQVEKFPTFYGT